MRFLLREEDLEIIHVKGSGPGGQHKNKRQTGIRITHIPTGITILSTERRTQSENLRTGKERLIEKLTRHFYRPPERTETKPTKSSKKRRIESKKKRSSRKAERRFKGEDY